MDMGTLLVSRVTKKGFNMELMTQLTNAYDTGEPGTHIGELTHRLSPRHPDW